MRYTIVVETLDGEPLDDMETLFETYEGVKVKTIAGGATKQLPFWLATQQRPPVDLDRS